MALDKHPNQEPIRLVDPEDKSLTLLHTEKMGHEAHYNEESAAEFPAPQDPSYAIKDEEEEESVEKLMNGKAMGIFSLVLSILSLFFLPLLLGAAGIIVGFVAIRGGSKTIGSWAIGLGIVSITASLFFSTVI